MPSIKAEQKRNALEQTHVMKWNYIATVLLQTWDVTFSLYLLNASLDPDWSNQPWDSDMTPCPLSSQKGTLFLHSCGSLARGTWSAGLWCLPLKSHQPQFSCNCRAFNRFKRETYFPPPTNGPSLSFFSSSLRWNNLQSVVMREIWHSDNGKYSLRIWTWGTGQMSCDCIC